MTESTMTDHTHRFDAMSPGRKAAYILACFVLGDLLILGLHLVLGGHDTFGAIFDLDKEGNLPTWFSSCKFSVAALAAALCFLGERRAGLGLRFRAAWLAISLLMLFMSADETAQFHEHAIEWIMNSPLGGLLRRAFMTDVTADALLWGLLASPLLMALAVYTLSFYWTRLRSRPLLMAGGGLAIALLAGALTLETEEAALLSGHGAFSLEVWNHYRVLTGLEELMEQLAASLLATIHFAYAFALEEQPSKSNADADQKQLPEVG
ncbi:MAG: hypothetical protein HQL63_04445 [Magnetococcales bacterium]|nr:hypothetical protein [Magnetococcales bacterium]